VEAPEGLARNQRPPPDLIFAILKRGELRMILRKERDECLQARSRKIKKLIVRLRDSSEIDFAPLIGRVVQKKVFDRYLGLEVLDYAIEVISSAAFPFESDWNVTMANVSLGGIEMQVERTGFEGSS
jgi:hypothetical protein